MNSIAMLVVSITVGFLGIPTTEKSTILFENQKQCISHLDILERKYVHYETQRSSNVLKVTNHANHSITIFKCP